MRGILPLVSLLAVSWITYVYGAEVVVSSDDPSVLLDQYFRFDNASTECNGAWWTEIVGSQASFNFTGMGISLIASRGRVGGVYDVIIDSIKRRTIDRWANTSSLDCGRTMFNITGLPNQSHNLVLILRGNSTDSTSEDPGYLDIEELRYTVPDSLATSTNPFDALTRTLAPSTSAQPIPTIATTASSQSVAGAVTTPVIPNSASGLTSMGKIGSVFYSLLFGIMVVGQLI